MQMKSSEKQTVFWDVTSCHLIEVLQCLEEYAATILKMGESSSIP